MQQDIDAQFNPTHDEKARQRFVSTIRKHAIVDLRAQMRDHYETKVEPHLGDANWEEISTAMEPAPVYQLYSSVRYNAQEMCFHSVQPTIERALPGMVGVLHEAQAKDTGGSLTLDPDMEVPRYVANLDVHLVPGYSHAEFTEHDVAQGAVVDFGGRVFTGLGSHRKMPGAVGDAVGYWASLAFPDLKAKRALDLGTASGNNLMPVARHFEGVELHGVDVGAPVLRYGHAKAQFAGIPVHFKQADAASAGYPDGHFDLIISSFFFHEIPVKVTRKVLAECYRMLAPGGVMVHMELPDESAISQYENFFWNWDTKNNNEPFYTQFRAQNPLALCSEAGFPEQDCFAHMIPSVGTYGEEHIRKFVRGEVEAPAHGQGGWFVFGGRKPA